MKNLVIATFVAAEGELETLAEVLRTEILPDTRAFDGCIELHVYQEEGTDSLTLVEDWVSLEHYDRYLAWRAEQGSFALVENLVEGGVEAGVRLQRFLARKDI